MAPGFNVKSGLIRKHVPLLPIEVYQAFVQFSPQEILPRLSLVNSTFRYEAQRLLFRDIDVESLRQLVLLLRVLATRSTLANLVHSWVIAPPRRFIHPLRSFYNLLSQALHQTHNLKHLELLLFGSYSHFLLGCPFRLTKLGIGADWDDNLSQWFVEQGELRNIAFYGACWEPPNLSTHALRSLQSLGGPSSALVRIVPGRPLDDVRFSLSDPTDLEAATLHDVAVAVSSSSAIVSSFVVQLRSPEGFMPGITWFDRVGIAEALQPIAIALPSLTSFTFLFGGCFVSLPILQGIGDFIQQLTHLKHLMLLSQIGNDCLHDIWTNRVILDEWSKICPSLQVVQFPDKLFAFGGRFGWLDSDSEDLSLEQYTVLTPIVKSYVQSQLNKW